MKFGVSLSGSIFDDNNGKRNKPIRKNPALVEMKEDWIEEFDSAKEEEKMEKDLRQKKSMMREKVLKTEMFRKLTEKQRMTLLDTLEVGSTVHLHRQLEKVEGFIKKGDDAYPCQLQLDEIVKCIQDNDGGSQYVECRNYFQDYEKCSRAVNGLTIEFESL